MKITIETLTVPTMTLPNDLPENSSAAQKRHWEKRIDEISKKEMIFEENMKTMFSIILGQVMDVLKTRIQALDDFIRMNAEGDSLDLLAFLQNQAHALQYLTSQGKKNLTKPTWTIMRTTCVSLSILLANYLCALFWWMLTSRQ